MYLTVRNLFSCQNGGGGVIWRKQKQVIKRVDVVRKCRNVNFNTSILVTDSGYKSVQTMNPK